MLKCGSLGQPSGCAFGVENVCTRCALMCADHCTAGVAWPSSGNPNNLVAAFCTTARAIPACGELHNKLGMCSRFCFAGFSTVAVAQPKPLPTASTPHEQLRLVDPTMANRLHPNDERKISRSLRVWQTYGVPHSTLIEEQTRQRTLRSEHCTCLWVDCNQDALDDRINRRVDSMDEGGIVEELLRFQHDLDPTVVDWDCTRGVFQAIGCKEFKPFVTHAVEAGLPLNTQTRATLGPEATGILGHCFENLKLATRQYCRRQLTWLRNRLFTESPGFRVYRVDSSQPELWDEHVLGPALAAVESVMQGTPQASMTLKPTKSPAAALASWEQHVCEVCNNRVFNGQAVWLAHLQSRKHRRATRRKQRASARSGRCAKGSNGGAGAEAGEAGQGGESSCLGSPSSGQKRKVGDQDHSSECKQEGTKHTEAAVCRPHAQQQLANEDCTATRTAKVPHADERKKLKP
eukprot:m.49965 g.49965  ORF g.49965 m.49965 type:complete len:462 (+) comp12114_c0_seq1:477-1862(+)